MTIQDWSSAGTIAVALVTIFGVVIGINIWINGRFTTLEDKVWTKIGVLNEKFDAKSDAVESRFNLRLDKEQEINSKARHDHANAVLAITGKIELDLKSVKESAVRREDLTSLETRLTGGLTKLENSLERMGDKVAAEFGRLVEKFQNAPRG